MNSVRKNSFSKAIALITGIFFLNMSFFLTEVRMLKLDLTDHNLIENIAKMISGSGFEEERDSMGKTTEGGETSLDFFISHHPNAQEAPFLMAINNQEHPSRSTISPCSEITTPPPKR